MLDLQYNRFYGMKILEKYIDKKDRRYVHSIGVSRFARRVAERIKHKNKELSFIDPYLVEFLGLVHDIGYSIAPEFHELHTIDLLIKNEGVPEQIAWMTMHGQIPEQHGARSPYYFKCLPRGLEGMILTYADMTVGINPMYMETRKEEIKERLEDSSASQKRKEDILIGLDKAFPRFQRFEKAILELAGVGNYTHFGFKKYKPPQPRKKVKSKHL